MNKIVSGWNVGMEEIKNRVNKDFKKYMNKEQDQLLQEGLRAIELLRDRKAIEALMELEERAGYAKMYCLNQKHKVNHSAF